jgi:hypothetical protein
MNSLVLQFNSSFPGDQHDPNRPPPWPRPRFASGFGEAAAFTFGAAAGFPQCPKTKAIICHILGSWDLGNSSSLAPPKSSVFYVWIQPEPKKNWHLKAGPRQNTPRHNSETKATFLAKLLQPSGEPCPVLYNFHETRKTCTF